MRFCQDSSTIRKNNTSKEIKCVKPNCLVIEIPFKITNLPIFIILIININMMISPWWLQLIRLWSHICFFCLSPTFHPCWAPSVVDWWWQTKTFCSKPTTTSESKGRYSALLGNYNTKSKALQISRGLSYPDISGVLEFMYLWQLESMSNTGPCKGHRHTGTQPLHKAICSLATHSLSLSCN